MRHQKTKRVSLGRLRGIDLDVVGQGTGDGKLWIRRAQLGHDPLLCGGIAQVNLHLLQGDARLNDVLQRLAHGRIQFAQGNVWFRLQKEIFWKLFALY